MKKIMKQFDDRIKVGSHNSVKFVSDLDFKFISGKESYNNDSGAMSDAAKSIYKKIDYNCCFVIMGVCNTHFIMIGFKHTMLNYGYCECHDYWGTTYRFIENDGVIKYL